MWLPFVRKKQQPTELCVTTTKNKMMTAAEDVGSIKSKSMSSSSLHDEDVGREDEFSYAATLGAIDDDHRDKTERSCAYLISEVRDDRGEGAESMAMMTMTTTTKIDEARYASHEARGWLYHRASPVGGCSEGATTMGGAGKFRGKGGRRRMGGGDDR